MIEEISIVKGDTFYMLRFPHPFRKYSSAPYGGGFGSSVGYINRSVPSDYKGDPVAETDAFLFKNGIESSGLTVTMTACRIENVIMEKRESDGLQLIAAVTGGSSNALSIGSSGFDCIGTINICVISDADMDDDAALNLFMGITEAKAQAMNDLGIRDRITGEPSPGTSTDTVSLFQSGDGKRFRYGGRLTKIGMAVSTMVYGAVKSSLSADYTELS